MCARRRVSFEVVCEKLAQMAAGFGVSASEPCHRGDAEIDPQPCQKPINVVQVKAVANIEPSERVNQVLARERAQEPCSGPQQLRPKGASGNFRLTRGHRDRNENVAFDLQNTPPGAGRHPCPPLLLGAKVAPITNNEGGLLREFARRPRLGCPAAPRSQCPGPAGSARSRPVPGA